MPLHPAYPMRAEHRAAVEQGYGYVFSHHIDQSNGEFFQAYIPYQPAYLAAILRRDPASNDLRVLTPDEPAGTYGLVRVYWCKHFDMRGGGTWCSRPDLLDAALAAPVFYDESGALFLAAIERARIRALEAVMAAEELGRLFLATQASHRTVARPLIPVTAATPSLQRFKNLEFLEPPAEHPRSGETPPVSRRFKNLEFDAPPKRTNKTKRTTKRANGTAPRTVRGTALPAMVLARARANDSRSSLEDYVTQAARRMHAADMEYRWLTEGWPGRLARNPPQAQINAQYKSAQLLFAEWLDAKQAGLYEGLTYDQLGDLYLEGERVAKNVFRLVHGADAPPGFSA